MTEGDTGAPLLVLGPLLRYVGENEATIWVETDRACEVEVLGHQARTFEVSGHHYALVVVGGLRPGTEHEYQVALDGAVRWPEPDSDFPPSVLRTPDPAGRSGSPSGPAGSPSCPYCRAGSAPAARSGTRRNTARTRWSLTPWTCAERRTSGGPT